MSPKKSNGGDVSPLAPASSPEAAGSLRQAQGIASATPLSGAAPRNAPDGNWRKVSIDQIKASTKNAITIGPFGSRMKSDCYVPSGVPVIRGNNLTSGRGFGADFVYITEEKAKELRNCMVFEGDLVFPHRGAIGEVGIVPPSDKPFILSSSLMKLTCDPNQADPLFLFYFFKSDIGRFELLKNASQVGTPGIGQPLSSLKSIELNLPSPEVQKSIAHILGTLDDKIELNRRINQTLEEMAQALFKSWFVDFDPVRAKAAVYAAADDSAHSDPTDPAIAVSTVGIGHARSLQRQKRQWQGSDCEQQAEWAAMRVISGKTDDELVEFRQAHPDAYAELAHTASLFPSRLTESELGKIPEGWTVSGFGSVSECFDNKRIPLSKSEREKRQGTIPYYGATSQMGLVDKPIFQGCYLLLGEDGSVVKEDGTPFTQYVWGSFWVNNHAHVLQGRGSVTTEHLLTFISGQNIKAYVNGAVQAKLNQGNMNKIPFLLASEEINQVFGERLNPLYAKFRQVSDEIKEIETLRDSLLPKLLSGELEIPDVLLAEVIA